MIDMNKQPVSNYFKVTNGIDTYVLDKGSVYHSQYLNDDLGVTYYIYIENSYSRTIIECVDTLIDGSIVTAQEWKESIMLTLEQEILK